MDGCLENLEVERMVALQAHRDPGLGAGVPLKPAVVETLILIC